jgi:hypothetical protein
LRIPQENAGMKRAVNNRFNMGNSSKGSSCGSVSAVAWRASISPAMNRLQDFENFRPSFP